MKNEEKITQAQKDSYQRILQALDIEVIKEDVSETDIEDRAHDAELFYKQWAKDLLMRLTFEQVKQLGSQGINEVMVAFNNGVLYGFQILDDWFAKQLTICESKQPGNKQGESDTGINPVGGNPLVDK